MNDDEHKGFELELYHRNRVGDFISGKGMLTITRQVCLDYNKDQQYGNSWDNWRNNNLYQRYQGIQWGYEVVGRYRAGKTFGLMTNIKTTVSSRKFQVSRLERRR